MKSCCGLILLLLVAGTNSWAQTKTATAGSLRAVGKSGKPLGDCLLQHTAVKVEISGMVARVRVAQTFANPFPEKIEAIYAFPLSLNAAVDEMAMHVGGRTVKGEIRPLEEARAVYETAKQRGLVAALLDQERPNIFTQAVANIVPGEEITVAISYVETLRYEAGVYEFVFPMTIGPRYVPPGRVADAARISPPAMRGGRDISLEITLDAGVPLESFRSPSHAVETLTANANHAVVHLANERTIPNKDFILRYDVAGKRISDAVLTHQDERGGFFTLILQPPATVAALDVNPKEMVFVLDTSGSMEGFPIEKAKEAMKLALDGLYPNDTFNLITFAGETEILFDQPVPATPDNLALARAFLDFHGGSGGTEMMAAIRAALQPSDTPERVRVVCFMTDGYVGNEGEILSEIQHNPNARVFSFGIGDSVNRFLLDKMAEAGRGAVEYVGLNDDGSAAARHFHEHVRNPLLTDIRLDWNDLPVTDVYPQRLPDLFGAQPLIITGRYQSSGRGVLHLHGRQAGQEIVREIPVELPEKQAANDALASLWARARVDDLTRQNYAGISSDTPQPAVKEAVTKLGVEFRLLTRFTSFVAVEETTVTPDGPPRRVVIPTTAPANGEQSEEETQTVTRKVITPTKTTMRPEVAPPDIKSARLGNINAKPASRAVTFGDAKDAPDDAPPSATPPSAPTMPVSSGVVNGRAISLPRPAYPALARAAHASGIVSVQVTIDEEGKVIAARAVAGHPLLQTAAVQAARRAQFTPVRLSGQAVKVTGVINYNFLSENVLLPGFNPLAAALRLSDKLHPQIEAHLRAPSARAAFVHNGQASVVLWLTARTPETLAALQQLAFVAKYESPYSRIIIGDIPPGQLATLIQLNAVRYLAPWQ